MLRAVPLMLTLAACACDQTHRDRADDLDNGVASQAVMPRVHLAGADGADHAVTVEVVRKEAELQKGLMFRRKLDADAGMLFMMGEEDIHTFWMRNTYLPLDMIFITRDMHVAGIAADAVPQTDDLRSVDTPSFYVLEVNAGWSKAHGVGAGARVSFENIRP